MDENTVKRDLKQLGTLSRAIDSEMRASKKLEYYIKSGICTDKIKDKLAKHQAAADRFAKEATALVAKYIDAISSLVDITDRAIATEVFLNGRTYQAIGTDFYLSVDGIKYRMRGIYRQITEYFDTK